jgi:hypothetical protein
MAVWLAAGRSARCSETARRPTGKFCSSVQSDASRRDPAGSLRIVRCDFGRSERKPYRAISVWHPRGTREWTASPI